MTCEKLVKQKNVMMNAVRTLDPRQKSFSTQKYSSLGTRGPTYPILIVLEIIPIWSSSKDSFTQALKIEVYPFTSPSVKASS